MSAERAREAMSEDDKKSEPIFKVDTVPPPPGESDAYNAPTRIGPMAAAVIGEMIVAAERAAAERAAQDRGGPSARPPVVDNETSGVVAKDSVRERPPPPVPAAGLPPPAPVPRLYEENDEDAETRLSRSARPPVVAPQTETARFPFPPSPVPNHGGLPGVDPAIPPPGPLPMQGHGMMPFAPIDSQSMPVASGRSNGLRILLVLLAGSTALAVLAAIVYFLFRTH